MHASISVLSSTGLWEQDLVHPACTLLNSLINLDICSLSPTRSSCNGKTGNNLRPTLALLDNPKTKLFITHGGYNSLLESSKAGLPLVMIPLFADQLSNAARAERHGLGVVLPQKDQITSEAFASAIGTVLGNPRWAKILFLWFVWRPSWCSIALFWSFFTLQKYGLVCFSNVWFSMLFKRMV